MKVLVINNDGSGFADYVDVDEGTNALKVFHQQIKHGEPGDYLIRINRLPCPADQVLHEMDRISITPIKIEVALAA